MKGSSNDVTEQELSLPGCEIRTTEYHEVNYPDEFEKGYDLPIINR